MNPEFGNDVKENVALPYLVYKECIFFVEGDRVVYEDDVMSLEEYKDRKYMLVSRVVGEENGLQVLPGENEPSIRYEVASEHAKKISRTILKSIRSNELRLLCFSDFDASHIFVSRSGRIKFRNVRILANLSSEVLHMQLGRNYMSAHAIIGDLFSGFIPLDIQHLLKLIEKNKARELYHIHGSLVPMGIYSSVFKSIYDFVRFEIPLVVLRDILDKLPYVDSWKRDIDSNELLKMTFSFGNSKFYDSVENKEGQTEISKEQRSKLSLLGLIPEAGQQKLTEQQIKLINALQFLEYLRNRTTHRLELLRKWIKDYSMTFNAEGSELVSHVRFPLMIPYLQKKLLKNNMLTEIRMENYF